MRWQQRRDVRYIRRAHPLWSEEDVLGGARHRQMLRVRGHGRRSGRRFQMKHRITGRWW